MQPFDIIQDNGFDYFTGMLPLPVGHVCFAPLFEDRIPLLTKSEIEDIAKGGAADGRNLFPRREWVMDQKSHGCVPGTDEVLTERGWRQWQDYNWSDLLGTMNPTTGFLEFQPPTAKHVYEYDGEMVCSTNRRLDFSVTPNHRMFVRKWDERKRSLSDSYSFVEADKLGWYAGIPHSTKGFLGVNLERVSIPGGREYLGNDFLALLSVVISDGWASGSSEAKGKVSFCCFREDRYQFVSELAHRTGFKEQPGRKGVWHQTDHALAEWLRVNIYTKPELGAVNKRIPDIVKTVSMGQVSHFLKFFGDQDSDNRTGSRRFYTTSERLADDLQELMLRVGKRGSLYQRPARESVMADGRLVRGGNTERVVYEALSDKLSFVKKNDYATDHYKGQVYCATVPNGTLVTRRNGSVLISGNSCNGFAGAGALSAARVRRGNNIEKILLSGAYLYSLINRGQDNGSLLNEGMKALQESGCATADTVPWDHIYPRQQRPEAANEAKRFKAFECYKVGSQDGLWSALALGFDCVVAVHAGNNFMRLDGNGVAGVDRGPGNHAVRADGIAWVGEPAATHIGSWNVSYGKDGGSLLTWKSFAQTFGNHDFYAVRSTSDDPDAVNPPRLA